jgi:hypothetical protein
VTPEEFGFSRDMMKENRIPLIVCSRVGLKGLVMHTEMAHIFRQAKDGFFMFSRFWLGERLKSGIIKKDGHDGIPGQGFGGALLH